MYCCGEGYRCFYRVEGQPCVPTWRDSCVIRYLFHCFVLTARADAPKTKKNVTETRVADSGSNADADNDAAPSEYTRLQRYAYEEKNGSLFHFPACCNVLHCRV